MNLKNVNCRKIVAYAIKIMKFLVHIISAHTYVTMSLMFQTETVEPCLVQKLKWRYGCD